MSSSLIFGQVGSDDCVGATPIAMGITTFDTTAATTDGPPACALIANDHWFLFVAPNDATYEFSLCDVTDYDAAMAAYPDSAPCPPDSGDAMACNDDACGGGGPPIIELTLTVGETVRLQVGGWQGSTGSGEIAITEVAPPPPLAPEADILVGDIFNFTQFGREGSEVGCGIASTTCNAGVEPLDWFGNPDPRHPFITSAAYRLENDRLVQLGMSFAKHGFAAAQTDACGLGCSPFSDSTRLGVGCSDIYGAATNANQSNLGLRSEINPWTGAFDYSTSILSTTSGPFDGVERRLRLHDDDLDPVQHPEAEWFCEIYVLAHDDYDHTNSVAWEPFTPVGSPGGIWSFDTSATATVGAAIHAWPGAQIVEVMDPVLDDGRVYLAAKAIDLGGGAWRYEYAIQNLDLSEAIGALSILVPASVSVTDIGFHAPNQLELGFDDQPWSAVRTADAVEWATDSADTATPQNPLRWGALYNFWFTANTAPQVQTATLGVHFATTVAELTGESIGPEGAPGESFRRGDVNEDGQLNIADPILGLTRLFDGLALPECYDAHDANDDALWDIADTIFILSYLFAEGPSPALPFPDCGPDVTEPDGLDCLTYAGCP